jgi:hypothetical protein
MPNINLADKRQRDAVVKAESVRIDEPVRYLGPKGGQTYTRRILKSTTEHDYDALVAQFGDAESISQALINGDPEVDLERFGQFLFNTSRVYITPDEEIVFRVSQTEVVRDTSGKVTERRDREPQEPNVDSDIPLSWTGKLIPKLDAIRRFVFVQKLQVVHVNGLTYDFLFAMAKELAEAKSLLLLGAGKDGKQPLIFRRGSIPYRAFLEGRVDGERYTLILHLSNMELKPRKVSQSP